MSKDPAKLEKALAKQARRDARKQKDNARKEQIQSLPDVSRVNAKQAGSWSLLGCWVNEDWADHRSINQLVVARKNAVGVVAIGLFLIDLGCLGIKNAMTRGFDSEFQFKTEFLELLNETQTMQPCSLDFSAKMIQTAIVYAKGLGFEPHKDARKAMPILGEAHPENCTDQIPTGGEDGRPYFFSGPYDNVTRIINTLNRTVGEGNYNFIIGNEDDFLDEIDFDNLEFIDDDEDDFEDDEKTIDVVAKSA